MSIEIKKVEATNLEVLLEVSIETFVDTFASQNTEKNMKMYMDKAFNINKLEAELQNEYSMFYFIHIDQEIAGYLKLNTETAQTENVLPETLEVERIYIRTKYQRRGLGKELLTMALAKAKQLNKRTVWLGVWEENSKAIAFYQSLDFVHHGAHCFYMGDEKQTDFIMVKQINE